MNGMLESTIITIIGFVIGGIVLTVIASFSLKFFVKRIVKELMSDETKGKFSVWLEEVILNSVAKSLKDKKVKHAVLEVLEIVSDRIRNQ